MNDGNTRDWRKKTVRNVDGQEGQDGTKESSDPQGLGSGGAENHYMMLSCTSREHEALIQTLLSPCCVSKSDP